MTATCPNCGKPLRPGARFCGSCGFDVTAESPSHPPAESPSLHENGELCPHCGNKVRPGAKFCNTCGKTIVKEKPEIPSQPAVEPETPASREPVTEPEMKLPPKESAAAPPPPVVPPAEPGKKTKAPRKRIWIWILLLVLAVLCVAAAGGSYLYFQDPLGWRATATPTASPLPAATDTPQVIETEMESPTLTPIPSLAATPTIEVLPTEVMTPTVEASPTSEPVIIFEDDFSGALNAYWRAWGDPRPKISTGPGDNWLDLTAAEDYGSGGVTSQPEIVTAPGTEITFRGQLNESYPQYVMFFDWDPLHYRRGPDNQDPGVIHFELHRNRLVLFTPLTKANCEKELDGTTMYTYRMSIREGQSLDLYIDEELTPVCQIADIGLAPVPGKISYTGVGWITEVRAIGP